LRHYQEICEKDPWRSSADDSYFESLKSDEKAKAALIRGAVDLSRLGRQTEPALTFIPDDEDSVLPEEMQPSDILRPGYDDYTR
jgi:hypothetical protein